MRRLTHGPPLDETVDLYLLACAAAGLAPSTIHWYGILLGVYIRWQGAPGG